MHINGVQRTFFVQFHSLSLCPQANPSTGSGCCCKPTRIRVVAAVAILVAAAVTAALLSFLLLRLLWLLLFMLRLLRLAAAAQANHGLQGMCDVAPRQVYVHLCFRFLCSFPFRARACTPTSTYTRA